MNVAIYCRVGDKSQIDEQARLCRDILTEQEQIYKMYIDIGHSANSENRPGILSLMKDAAEGNFGLVIASDYARIARSPLKVMEFEQGLNQLGIKLKVVM